MTYMYFICRIVRIGLSFDISYNCFTIAIKRDTADHFVSRRNAAVMKAIDVGELSKQRYSETPSDKLDISDARVHESP